MQWYIDEKEKLAETKTGKKLLEEYQELFEGFDDLLRKSDDRFIKAYSQEELTSEITALITKVNQLSNKSTVLENGHSIVLKHVFQRLTKNLKTRVDRKWEENLLDKLKEVREQRGMTKADLAKMSGLSQSYINRIESGERHNISVDKLRSLCQALDIPMESVVRDSVDVGGTKKFEDLMFDSTFTIDGTVVDAKQKFAIINLVKEMKELNMSSDLSLTVTKIMKIAEDFKHSF